MTPKELSDMNMENRARFTNIIAIALNIRRSFREMILPEIQSLRSEMEDMKAQLNRIENLLQASVDKRHLG